MTTLVSTTLTLFPPFAVRAAVTRAIVDATDRPDPALDGDRTLQEYAALAQEFRNSAWQHLNAGDLPQASYKAWAFFVETIKAIAARHGAIIYTHRAIMLVVTELAKLVDNAGDPVTARWVYGIFLLAGALHTNSYENEFPKDMVMDGLMACEDISELMYRLFAAPAPAV